MVYHINVNLERLFHISDEYTRCFQGASIFLLMAARNFYHPPPKLNETDGTNNDIETEAGVVTDQNCKDSNGVELKQGIIYKNDYDNPSFIK